MGFQMKYQIKKQYITIEKNAKASRRRGVKAPSIDFLVAHDTGNPGSTAAGNVGYYERSRTQVSASAHVFVDDKEIIECIPLLTGTPEKAWHVLYGVTKDNRLYGDDANDVAGGYELCWGKGIDSNEAYKRFVWVMAYSCYKFKLDPAKKIVGHEILDPGRKIDPSNGLKYMGKTYQQLLKDIVKEYNACLGKTVVVKPDTKIATSGTYTIEKGDTLWGIAQDHEGVSVNDLLAWNPSIDPSNLKVGQKINMKKPAAAKKPASTPTKAPAKKKWDLPHCVLRRGSKGSDVLKMQNGLSAMHFYPEKGAPNNGCDSIYGEMTEDAVRRFQLVHMGEDQADGVYGPNTEAKLEALLN